MARVGGVWVIRRAWSAVINLELDHWLPATTFRSMADSDMSGPLSAVASVSVYYFVRHRAWKWLSARILIGCHSIILLVRILLQMVKSATR